MASAAILNLLYSVDRPPTKPCWWTEEDQKSLCQSADQFSRYVDFSFRHLCLKMIIPAHFEEVFGV